MQAPVVNLSSLCLKILVPAEVQLPGNEKGGAESRYKRNILNFQCHFAVFLTKELEQGIGSQLGHVKGR